MFGGSFGESHSFGEYSGVSQIRLKSSQPRKKVMTTSTFKCPAQYILNDRKTRIHVAGNKGLSTRIDHLLQIYFKFSNWALKTTPRTIF